MKFTLIVLLAVCALAAHGQKLPSFTSFELQPEFRGPVVDGIKQAFKDVIEFVSKSFDKVTNKAKEVIETIKRNIGNVIGDAMKKVWEVVKTLAKLAEKGMAAKFCYKPHAERIAELQQEMEAGMQECSAISMAAINDAKELLEQSVRQIQDLAEELADMVTKCFDSDGNILGGTWCVAKNVFEIRDKVKLATEIAEMAIEEIQERALTIINNHQDCVANVQDVPMREMMKIVAEIQQCIAENT